MTTKSSEQGTAQARRRQTSRLTVVAGSALTLAVSWLGVMQADRAQPEALVGVAVPQQAAPVTPVTPVTPVASPTQVTAEGAAVVVPAPPTPAPAPRQVIVVRTSRAS
jgi:hypothetical protein